MVEMGVMVQMVVMVKMVGMEHKVLRDQEETKGYKEFPVRQLTKELRDQLDRRVLKDRKET